MSKRVFFSFHFDRDINRVMIVRNSHITKNEKRGFIDKAEFETIQRKGEIAVKSWIDKQLSGTSVTVVLLGSETLSRPYVQYEIIESYKKGNKIIAINICGIKDLKGNLCKKQSLKVCVGRDNQGNNIYFDNIINDYYDYIDDNGYQNLESWINK
ncbi:TIR domain-containing protein [Macrococcus brunensis]|uniref:TIR domain-containing protein n=1 Tax=Macrococcus brunensis TaxID=198483 RepID=UPI001EF013EF|nr:TIR domain-containing protein [Macrococcus brunensis]ULG71493.1 TIR domain-containing protein [Macrococcus brunensis]